MLEREWGVESNGKLPHLFIPSKLQPWFLSLQSKPAFGQNTLMKKIMCLLKS